MRIEACLAASAVIHCTVLAALSATPREIPRPARPIEATLMQPAPQSVRREPPATSARESLPRPSKPALQAPASTSPVAVTPEADHAPPSPMASAPSRPLPIGAAAPPAAAPTNVAPPRFDAEYLDNPEPSYPLAARRRGLEGTVMLEVLVDPRGHAASVQVAVTSGEASLDNAAADAVRSWRFVPARRGEEDVAAKVHVPIRFRIQGS